MKGSRRRVLGCAAVAATSAVLLVTAGSASAQKPEKVGDGVKTGQLGVQLFNYGGFISNAGGQGAASPIVIARPECASGGAQATTTDCRWYRLELLFKYLASKGVTNVELFGHAAFPSNAQTDPADPFGLYAYRALLDKYGLHAGGWHGDMSETAWDARLNAAKILGADYVGSGGYPSPGLNTYANTLATAQALNRLGKRAVEAGVGPTYHHNHQDEFQFKYVDDGVLKTAWEIIMDHSDPRYSVAEIDVKWSSDSLDDPSGQQTAALINKYGTAVQLLHIKDGNNIDEIKYPQSAPFAPVGNGEIDFRPIFAAAANRVRYYHQEHDGGTLTDAEISLTNLHGQGTAVVPAMYGAPTTFPSVPAGTPAASNVVPVVITNTGEAPMVINSQATGNSAGVSIAVDPLDAPVAPASDFQIVSNTCLGQTLPAATATTPRGSCVVNVGYGPSKSGTTSIAKLRIRSNADDATETVLLVGKSTNSSLGTVGGDVPSLLQLVIPNNGGSFGTFVPGVARDYLTQLAATVTTTTGDATLSVNDPSTNAPGKLVNGTFSLANPLSLRAVGLGDSPLPAYTPLPTDNTSIPLRNWSTPVTAAPLTIGFRQPISATEALRAGTYSKTLTFTLSTTTP
jgi:sugar phosphate isomerase/epimerase